ncbi:hypothetical protein ACF0H5_020162 [Mactra antiquata]
MKHCAKIAVKVLRRNLLLFLTLVGAFLGVGIGFAVRTTQPSNNALMWLGMPGKLYLRLLKMMIVPLIVSSVITGTASLDPKSNGKISLISTLFIFFTNTVGSVLGVLSFLVFKPGVAGDNTEFLRTGAQKQVQTEDIFADLLRNILPDNLFEATFRQTQTQYKYGIVNNTGPSNMSLEIIEKIVSKTDGPNLLGLIFACTLIGIASSSLGEKGKPLIVLFEAATRTVIVIIRWFLWTTPIGVLSLILVAIAAIPEVSSIFHNLGFFIIAVITALVIQQLLVMPLIMFLFTRKNPYRLLIGITKPWLIAFAAASTAVAIPEMLNACEHTLKLDKRIARFVIPFSVTLSANGSAVFIACSCLFISNISGFPPNIGTILMVGVLAAVSSLAIPSVPSASIVTIIMILTSLNIPVDSIALLLAVEFILDRLRSTSSVVSHTMCVSVTNHACKNNLKIEQTSDVEMDNIIIEQSPMLTQNGQANTEHI